MAVAISIRQWTLEDLERLPEDGNTYELVHGELFVTPPPATGHEDVIARLNALLVPYVERERLGHVYFPRGVVRYQGSQVEPDLTVRAELGRGTGRTTDWNHAPTPLLVVEVPSPYTRSRDFQQKKALYLEAGIAEYWIVDAEEREFIVVRPGQADTIARDTFSWQPPGATLPLVVDVRAIMG